MFIEHIKGDMNTDYWEQLCIQAYTIKYEDYHFVEVPARNQGDAGLEGFTQSQKGIAIQCYLPESDLTFKELYEHQRDKINRDINRLLDKENAEKNLKKMGIYAIEEWHFLTPEFTNKELIKYAKKKSDEVQKVIKADKDFYDYLDENFKIRLCTEKHIANYLTNIILAENSDIKLNIELIDEDKIDWTDSDNKIKKNVEKKVSKLTTDSDSKMLLIDRFMKSYVSGINELIEINMHSTLVYEKIINLVDEYTKKVELESLMNFQRMVPGERYKELNNEFLEKLDDELPFLTVASRSRLGRQVMAKWLGDCPLNFE